MPTVRDVLDTIEKIAPKRHSLGFDKIGLQVGNPHAEVRKAAVAMDRSLGAVRFAQENGAQLLLTHHPLIFTPIDTVDTRGHVGRTVIELIKGDINFIAAHTNWDAAVGGINDELGALFGLQDVRPCGTTEDVYNLKLVVYCPSESVDALLDAVSAEGAGVIGKYRRCAHMTEGRGTFLGGEGTSPTVGSAGQIENVHEYRLEVVLPAAARAAVTRALRKAHPYEEPAFEFLTMAAAQEQPLGRVGVLPEPTNLLELTARVDEVLSTRSWAWGDPTKKLKKVAVVGGAADGDWIAAQRAGADVMITGEVRQHIALEASESGLCILASGHYATEHPGSAALCRRMAAEMPDVEWLLFTPSPGLHGRPH